MLCCRAATITRDCVSGYFGARSIPFELSLPPSCARAADRYIDISERYAAREIGFSLGRPGWARIIFIDAVTTRVLLS